MWFKIQNHQVLIQILATPNAKTTKIIKVSDGKLHISLHAKPHKGEANKELISYLAQLFKLAKKEIILKQGEHSRYKKVIVPLVSSVQQFLNNYSK